MGVIHKSLKSRRTTDVRTGREEAVNKKMGAGKATKRNLRYQQPIGHPRMM